MPDPTATAANMNLAVRFSELVRKGLRFRSKFEEVKRSIVLPDFEWYPYDCFANLFYIQQLAHEADLPMPELIGNQRVLDVGAADGALSFFFESLGNTVHACDYSGSNINRMQAIRLLASQLHSSIEISDVNLDSNFAIEGEYGLALFLGILYHLKNPFYVLESLSRHSRYCLLSTRVARFSPDRQLCLNNLPLAQLLDAGDCNSDATNYWIFTPAGLERLVRRCGWTVCSSACTGASVSDPRTQTGDERMFMLLSSLHQR
jgi:hypothetical protein